LTDNPLDEPSIKTSCPCPKQGKAIDHEKLDEFYKAIELLAVLAVEYAIAGEMA